MCMQDYVLTYTDCMNCNKQHTLYFHYICNITHTAPGKFENAALFLRLTAGMEVVDSSLTCQF